MRYSVLQLRVCEIVFSEEYITADLVEWLIYFMEKADNYSFILLINVSAINFTAFRKPF